MQPIGILALQGDYHKHAQKLEGIGASVLFVREPKDLNGISGILLPGGESTTMGKLLVNYNLLDPLKKRIEEGLPVFATCAGTILLAKDIVNSDQPRLGVLDISIKRNAYGRQIESFEAYIPVTIPQTHEVECIFIRAPQIKRIGGSIEVLAEYENLPILIKSGNIIAATFHPELSEDTSIQRYFMDICKNNQ